MPITRSTDAPSWQLPGTLFTGLASPGRGGSTELSVWHIRMDAQTPSTPHSVTRTEVFTIIVGTAQVRIGAGPVEAVGTGDTLVVPADVVFELGNATDLPFEAIVCFPAGGQAMMPGSAPFTPAWSV